METNFFFSRDSEAAFGTQSATMGGSFWIRIRLGKAVGGTRCSGPRRPRQMETNLFFSRDSEAAFGTQSATMGGSFWMFGAKMTETNGNKLFF